MRKNLLKLFTGLSVFLMILLLCDISFAQRRVRGGNFSKQQIEQLLERLEEKTDKFVDAFDEALDASSLDTTATEERYTDTTRYLENVTDELRREFDHNDTRGETSANARKVLNTATEVNRIMNTRTYGYGSEAMWVNLRSELNTLARVYGLPSVGARSYRFVASEIPRYIPPRGTVNSKQQVEQLLERIEERNDLFTNQLNKSLDRSRLDGSKTEDNIAERARDLENATDELRREFDHNDTRGETSWNARKVLYVATEVNRLMRSRNFGGQTETTWVTLRAEINALARIYGLPAVGSRNY